MNNVAVDVSEAAVDAVLADGELLMIDSHEVKDNSGRAKSASDARRP